MSPGAIATVARLHAVLAWAATAALLAAPWIARSGAARRLRRGVRAGAIALLLATSALGLALHDTYRAKIRQHLFISAPDIGWLFERKLHLAFASALLGVGALAALFWLERTPADAPERRELGRGAALAWGASAALALAASIAGAIVARRAHF